MVEPPESTFFDLPFLLSEGTFMENVKSTKYFIEICGHYSPEAKTPKLGFRTMIGLEKV